MKILAIVIGLLFLGLLFMPPAPDPLPKLSPGTNWIQNRTEWESLCEFGRMGARMTEEQREVCRSFK